MPLYFPPPPPPAGSAHLFWGKKAVCLTFHVEQLILDGDLRLAPSLSFAVDHTLVMRLRLKVYKASLHVINNVCSVGRDFFGRKLSVERDFG